MYQEELEIMSKPIINTEIETVIKICQNKSPEPDGFIGEFYQRFSGELMPIFLKLFPKIAEEGILPNSFYAATITDTKTKQRYHEKRKV